MIVLRQNNFSHIDWKEVKEDVKMSLSCGGMAGLLVAGHSFIDKGVSPKKSILYGLATLAGVAGLVGLGLWKLGKGSRKEYAEKQKHKEDIDTRLKEISKKFPWINDIVDLLPKEYWACKKIGEELLRNVPQEVYEISEGDDVPNIHEADKDWIIEQILKSLEEGKNPRAEIIYGGYGSNLLDISYDFKTHTFHDSSTRGEPRISNVKKALLDWLASEKKYWKKMSTKCYESDKEESPYLIDYRDMVIYFIEEQERLVKKYL